MHEQSCDVAVIGGGPSGFGAALGAAHEGASVILIERHPMLGGMGTAGLVNNFCNAHHDGDRLIIGGVFGQLRERLIARHAIFANAAIIPWMEPYDPEVYAGELQAMASKAGVQLQLGTTVRSVQFSDKRADITLGDGHVIHARVIVDASGDAIVADKAGVPSRFGRPGDGAVMPLTYCYLIGPVDLDRAFAKHPELRHVDAVHGKPFLWLSGWREQIKEARAKGTLTIERDHVACAVSVPGRVDHVTVNFGRVFVDDPTDPNQLAAAETIGRRQVDEGIAFLREYVAGFENVKLVELARQIGVRQSRQIEGLYTLTSSDVLQGRQFDDVIAQCHYPIDIHEPKSDRTTFMDIPRGVHYDIPWRCLIPREGPPNLIVGGRSISATHEAMSSFRVSPSAMALGEAAGTTAALAAANGCNVAKVNPTAVQTALRRHGAILD